LNNQLVNLHHSDARVLFASTTADSIPFNDYATTSKAHNEDEVKFIMRNVEQ